jgi:hypothetical protein
MDETDNLRAIINIECIKIEAIMNIRQIKVFNKNT